MTQIERLYEKDNTKNQYPLPVYPLRRSTMKHTQKKKRLQPMSRESSLPIPLYNKQTNVVQAKTAGHNSSACYYRFFPSLSAQIS